ncbi:hypothetical protein JY411_19370, partial [Stenotrophomonas maltophilia]|nr:hypothetical protein [Stenotrophomonas maltophilia]
MAWIYRPVDLVPCEGRLARSVDPRHAWMGLANQRPASTRKKTRCLRSGFPMSRWRPAGGPNPAQGVF